MIKGNIVKRVMPVNSCANKKTGTIFAEKGSPIPPANEKKSTMRIEIFFRLWPKSAWFKSLNRID